MKLIPVVICGQKFEGNFLDPDVAEKFELATDEAIAELTREVEGENGSQGLRRQCNAICRYADKILGEGSAERLFPNGADLLSCLDAFEELCNMHEKQIAPVIQRRTIKYSAARVRRSD